jgi:CHAT domain-containing protein
MKHLTLRFLICSLFLKGYILGVSAAGIDLRDYGIPGINISGNRLPDEKNETLRKLNIALQSLLSQNLIDSSKHLSESIVRIIEDGKCDDYRVLSDSYYLVGVYYLYKEAYPQSIRFLSLFVSSKEKNRDYDESMSKALFNLGIAKIKVGDFNTYMNYSLRALELDTKIFGGSSPKLVSTYTSVIVACIELQQYEEALNYASMALTIVGKNPGSVSEATLGDLYYNMGVCYTRLVDYSKAKIYLEQSENIYVKTNLVSVSNYFNLVNSLAITYGALGLTDDSYRYYEKGISLAVSAHSSEAYNLVNSYAIFLGKNGRLKKGESLQLNALKMAKIDKGENSHEYIEVLKNYAEYLREFNIDNKKSIALYEKCIAYLDKNPQDNLLKDPVGLGYSLSLSKAGKYYEALSIIQTLLFPDRWKGLLVEKRDIHGFYLNPTPENIKPDKKSLNLLRTKYSILKAIGSISPGREVHEATSNTSELIVSLIEKVRLNIGQEQSRLMLGDRYRDSYFNAINDLNLLYSETSDEIYLEKAFIYSEKSKVAGLLTSAREIYAGHLNIPSVLVEMERKLQKDINLIDAHINQEVFSNNPDTILIQKWKADLLESTRKKDSLVNVFEEKYPGYYAIKYNTNVASRNDIPKIIGRNSNYLNYLASDTMLYIFIANRKNLKLLSVPVDSSFYDKIRHFRRLLSMPGPTDKARDLFDSYQSVGNDLYNILVNPVSKYLISDRIIISPDNILSYLPFETLPVSKISDDGIMFRKIDYLLNKYDVSYVYSATFMDESAKGNFSSGPGNSTIAFAPVYTEKIDIHDLNSRQNSASFKLSDLPYARLEAEYVSQITGGKLYEGADAKESVFKTEAGNFDIIHLAMHTVVNDKEPMLSTLIFSPETNTTFSDDRYLKTYEIYGIPLKAKMVVLSSCNTGSGLLHTGEGIMSLARGFIYSGSKSVVMSMWEIDDRSGTEIVKMFYKNLNEGDSKSMALRKARIKYLKKADQFRSLPYFWSALVIYGDNSPLFHWRKTVIITLSFIVIMIGILIYYFRKRRYS